MLFRSRAIHLFVALGMLLLGCGTDPATPADTVGDAGAERDGPIDSDDSGDGDLPRSDPSDDDLPTSDDGSPDDPDVDPRDDEADVDRDAEPDGSDDVDPDLPTDDAEDLDASAADADGDPTADVEPDLPDSLDEPDSSPGDGGDALGDPAIDPPDDLVDALDGSDCGADGCEPAECPAQVLDEALGEPLATGSTADAPDLLAPTCGGAGAADMTYAWTAPADGDYTFSLVGLDFDAVLAAFDAACDGDELACSDDVDPTFELTLSTSQVVVLAVDGIDGDEGAFELHVDGNLVTSEAGRCDDARDNDGDGPADCLDGDCTADPACLPPVEDCDNGPDDDGDTLADCDDPDCTGDPVCADLCLADSDAGSVLATLTGSTTGAGDDVAGSCGGAGAPDRILTWTAPSYAIYTFDTAASAFDTVVYAMAPGCTTELGCNDNPAGSDRAFLPLRLNSGQQVALAIDGAGGAAGSYSLAIARVFNLTTEFLDCQDGLDNDGDGPADCDDVDCASNPACLEICNNGTDDDGDGLVDCADPACASNAAFCEVCTNALDDDDDFLTDCGDPDCCGAPACAGVACTVFETACTDGLDGDEDGATDCADVDCCGRQACFEASACLAEPADPTSIAPPVSSFEPTRLADTVAFLVEGPAPTQRGVVPGVLDPDRLVVVRGSVRDRVGPVGGIRVDLVGHPELGATATRADGGFELLANADRLVLRFWSPDHIEVQRSVQPAPGGWTVIDEVVLTPFDPIVTTVDFDGAAAIQVAEGSPVSDEDGSRQARLLFEPGTTASVTWADGTVEEVAALDIRATELTVGPDGPAAMPGLLPSSSAYTYAVELSADEAVAGRARRIDLDPPAAFYVDNFLDFPVGGGVPVGYFDRERGLWVGAGSGRIVEIVGEADGQALVSADADGLADDPAVLDALGIDAAERAVLADLYDPGASLWRAELAHFTPYDCNWPYGPPEDAEAPEEDPDEEGDDKDGDNECEEGCFIDVQSQSLLERVALRGTPFELVYASDRADGRVTAFQVDIPVTDSDPPASLLEALVEVTIAGRRFTQSFPADPDQVWTFTWDGLDAYGRELSGAASGNVRVSYLYQAQYYATEASFGSSFGRFAGEGGGSGGQQVSIGAVRGSFDIRLEREWPIRLGRMGSAIHALGGWSLDAHHVYDATTRTLLAGDGWRREVPVVVETFAGAASCRPFAEGMASGEACPHARAIAYGPDGTLFFTDIGPNPSRVRQISPDGRVYNVGYAPAGGVGHLAASPDGSIYYGAFDQIWRAVPRLPAVAGDPEADVAEAVVSSGDCGVPGPVGQALAAGPDGSLFFTASGSAGGLQVCRLGTDGEVTAFAGTGTWTSGLPQSGALALDQDLGEVEDLAVGPDGAVFIADATAHAVYRVAPDGRIARFAGLPCGSRDGDSCTNADYAGDGGPALDAALDTPRHLAVGRDGALYIAHDIPPSFATGQVVRRVRPDGAIETVAGGNDGLDSFYRTADGETAIDRYFEFDDIAIAPSGELVFAESAFDPEIGTRNGIRRLVAFLPGASPTERLFPSPDGQEVYVFTPVGRHLRTLDALTGATRLTFGYDEAGRLVEITDAFGNTTAIERALDGAPEAIVGPFGHGTELTLDPDGRLATIVDPAEHAHAMTYLAGGLLETTTQPGGGQHLYEYDAVGRLSREQDPDGDWQTFVREDVGGGFTVTRTTQLGEQTVYTVVSDETGQVRTTTGVSSGLVETTRTSPDGGIRREHGDGSTTDLAPAADPRWGTAAGHESSVRLSTPGGLTLDVTRSRTIEPPGAGPLDFDGHVEVVEVEGRATVTEYDAATRTTTITSPAGRISQIERDANGLLAELQVGDLLPVLLTYDELGRPATRTQGERVWTYSWDAAGQLETLTDPLDRETTFAWDAVGRLTTVDYPGGRSVSFAYDGLGRTTSVVPPGQPAHGLVYSPGGRLLRDEPPDAGADVDADTIYSYDEDGRLTAITRPDGEVVTFGYDDGFRLERIATDLGDFTYTYDDGFLASMAAPGPQVLSFERDGFLLTGTTWSGVVAGSVAHVYDDNLRATSQTVLGGNAVSFGYDADGLLTTAGALTLARAPETGLVTARTLGGIEQTYTHNGYGEVESWTAAHGATPLISMVFERDGRGRLVRVTETVEGVETVLDYAYDAAGHLDTVERDGVLEADYDWDLNGNRVAVSDGTVVVEAGFDARDRVSSQGTLAYENGPAGERLARIAPGDQRTDYGWDAFGSLRTADMPDGTAVSYVVDGRHRRVGRLVDGVVQQGWLYGNQTAIAAELDAVGQIRSRFVYGDRHVPDYLVRGGVTYAILADHLGSPRLVVNAATGAIAQRLRYDAFGVVLEDSQPGFQPFGFAGGLYDPLTGLVRFGARDYDPETGRWMTPDPLGFRARSSNLYAYVGGDPQNFVDPLGLQERAATAPPTNRQRAAEILEQARAAAQELMGPDAPPERVNDEVWTQLKIRRNQLADSGCGQDHPDYLPLMIAEHEAWARSECSQGWGACASVSAGNLLYDPLKAIAQGVGLEEHMRGDAHIPTSPASADSWVTAWGGVWDGLWE